MQMSFLYEAFYKASILPPLTGASAAWFETRTPYAPKKEKAPDKQGGINMKSLILNRNSFT
jgi:hypothetical protein